MRDGLRAVGVVHAKDGGLRKNVGATEARRMQRIAFDLCGTAEMALDEQRVRVSAEREGSGIELRAAGDELLGLAHVGDNFFDRHFGAAGHARHGERCAHQLQESAARDGVQPLGCALGEFAVHHLAEFGRAGELFEAAPVLGTLGFGEVLLDSCAIEMFARANVFAFRFVLCFFHYLYLSG